MAFRLYFDEDSVNRALIRALVARGMDITNAIDTGNAGSPDRVQLEHATADSRVLFTYNVGDCFQPVGYEINWETFLAARLWRRRSDSHREKLETTVSAVLAEVSLIALLRLAGRRLVHAKSKTMSSDFWSLRRQFPRSRWRH